MWRSFVKDGLMVLFTISILLISPAISFLNRDEPIKGFLIFVLACIVGIFSFCVAYYWRKRNIHATVFGPMASLTIFIAGVSLLWWLKFNFWIPIATLLMFIICGHFIGKKINAQKNT